MLVAIGSHRQRDRGEGEGEREGKRERERERKREQTDRRTYKKAGVRWVVCTLRG